ncbi:hypothetical protein [Xanthomonas sp. BRIP62415]|uniref:hypothetical protein n=1 Tax=Xanthomonas sp. BRIP62415 TaxID=2182390 RepID=UPI000F8F3EA5|nr:hypothetical protein [Xanthomonas sp. BRIP62415]
MQIDASQFPITWMRKSMSAAGSAISPFVAFEALLARKEVFLLINEDGLDGGEHPHSPEEKKQMSLWMKRHKNELRTYVKAAIYVEKSSAKRLASRAFASMYEKFWGYPMLMVATKDEALTLARTLLPGDP